MKQNLEIERTRIEDNSVVIRKFIKGIEGGRTLDFPASKTTSEDSSGTVTTTVIAAPDVLHAGHVIVKTSDGKYQPLAVKTVTVSKNGEADKVTATYDTKPAGSTYVGVLSCSVLKKKPAAAIMTWGIVNEEALPYAVPSDFKTDCKFIDYQKDEEA